MYSIAKKYNLTVDELKKINNLDTNTLQVGQNLITVSNSQDNYIVKPGDTLYSIARKYNTTVNDIKNLNDLTNNFLSVNQELKIPK